MEAPQVQLIGQELLVCSWGHGGHLGWQEQNSFPPLGTWLPFHANSAQNNVLFCGCSARLFTDNIIASKVCNRQLISCPWVAECTGLEKEPQLQLVLWTSSSHICSTDRGHFLFVLGRFSFVKSDRPASIPIVMRISLSIRTNHPDQSNPKYYAQRRWFFSKTSWKKPISLPKCLVRLVLTFEKRP